MNVARSVLFAVISIAIGLIFASAAVAQTPVRLAATDPDTRETSIGQLVRSRFSDILLAGARAEPSVAQTQLSSATSPLDEEGESLELEEEPEAARSYSDDLEDDWSLGSGREVEGDEPKFDEDDFDEQDESEAELQRRRQASLQNRLAALRKPVTQIVIRATADGVVPEDRAEQLSLEQPMISITALGIGPIQPNRYTVGFMHRPLYFEQRNLERCGNGFGFWQNAVSSGHFLCDAVLLPYQLGQQRCDCCVQAGGDCQCCQSYPCDCNLCPVDRRGLLTQAAALAGFSLLVL